MVYQWYLFVLLIAVALLAPRLGLTYNTMSYGQKETRYRWLPALMILIPLIILAGTRSDFVDTLAYRTNFLNMEASLSEISDILDSDTKDKGFTIFTLLIKCIIGNNDVIYFSIIAAIGLLCMGWFYKKHSCNFAISMFLFIASADYIQWCYNGIRQFIAAAVVFASTGLLLKKKYILYYGIILLMSTIHASVLIMIPISLIVQGKPWNTKTVLFSAAIVIAINMPGPLNSLITDFMTETQYVGEVDQYLATEGTNIFRVLVFCIPPVMALVFKKQVEEANDIILDTSTNMSIISMGLYIMSTVTSGIFIGRLPIYVSLYNYILLPWIVEHIFDKKSQKLVYAIIIVCYLVFYRYQTAEIWNL